MALAQCSKLGIILEVNVEYFPDPDLRTLAAMRNFRVEMIQHYE
jgi:hypothetical protein